MLQIYWSKFFSTKVFILFFLHRKISHPSLIDLQAFQSRSQPECANVAEVSNLQTKESKAVVWLTAKDSSKSDKIAFNLPSLSD